MASVAPLHPDVATSLMLAVIASSQAPLALLDGDLAVIGLSASFCAAFGIEAADAPGKAFFDLGEGEWNRPQLRALLGAILKTPPGGDAGVAAYEMDLERAGVASRRLVLNAQKLAFDGGESLRLLLTVSDVTEARAAEKARDALLRDKDEQLRQKAILLEELHHRIANSLQIIAAILMQSAKRLNSEESRRHLQDAHNRVMSVASLQRQLAMSKVGDVELRWYFTDLCNSIAASMISDPSQLTLRVNVDESLANADVSVSLGLIVTELVINALKHAFPRHRRGEILVEYASGGGDWTLTVSDDGVGMPADGEPPPGLGTNIVEALAKHLDARIETSRVGTGASIAVIHGEAEPVPAA